MWKTKTPGIPDELFERDENVPITKEEVRMVQISKGRLKPGMIVYDIGCGSGSMSVEAALQVENSGHVHAVDYDPKAVELTKKNLAKFGISNVSVIGTMPMRLYLSYLMLMQSLWVEQVRIQRKLLRCV